MIHQTLKVKEFEAWVHLGCTIEEQKFSQPVLFSVEIQFKQNVEGINSDQLRDTVDYVTVTRLIKAVAELKPFHLIEHLCYETFLKLSDFLKAEAVSGQLTVDVHKVRVPVENLRGGVVFTCQAQL